MRTDGKAYEAGIKGKRSFSHLAQEQRTVMSDDVISAGHEISKPCYFMPVYTSASVQKCPHVDVSKKKKKISRICFASGKMLHIY